MIPNSIPKIIAATAAIIIIVPCCLYCSPLLRIKYPKIIPPVPKTIGKNKVAIAVLNQPKIIKVVGD